MKARTEVVVIGGGYAGTMAANRLAGDDSIDVTLLNARERFVERIRLHQWAAGSGEAARDYISVLSRRVRLVVDTVERIDVDGKAVILASGGTLHYDRLIYAPGGTATTSIHGAVEHAYSVADWESASRLRGRLEGVAGTVTIIGGGLTGIESAAEFAQAGHRVTLVSATEIMPGVSESARESTRRQLGRLGVEVREHTRACGVTASSVEVDAPEGLRELPSDTTVVATGFAVSPLARRSGLSCDSLGRLRTDAALVSVDDPHIVGAGDAVAPTGISLRMSCQSASPLGAQAAETVSALIAGDTPKPIDQGFAAQCVSLGRRAATLQFTDRDDAPVRRFMTGRSAAFIKEVVCRGTIWLLWVEARRPGTYHWLRAGRSSDESRDALGCDLVGDRRG